MSIEFIIIKVTTNKGEFWGSFQKGDRIATYHDALLYTARMFKALGLDITEVASRKRDGSEWGTSFTLIEGIRDPACGEAIWKAAGKGTEYNLALAIAEAEYGDFLTPAAVIDDDGNIVQPG